MTYTIPSGVTTIRITAYGAQGGSCFGGIGGRGAMIVGTFGVSPGDVLSILVGQHGGSTGYASGGGGTFVAMGSDY